MSSLEHNTSLFARTPRAGFDEFQRLEWLDLAYTSHLQGWLKFHKHDRARIPVRNFVPVAQVIDKPPTRNFPAFTKLPVEIQDKIWVMVSLRHRRVIAIVEEDVDVTLHPNDDEYTTNGAKRPNFVNACKGALNAMVGVYRPMFQLHPSIYHGTKKGVLVNPDIDIVEFISLRFLGQQPPLNYIGALKNPGDFAMIRHVCLPVKEFHQNFANVRQIIRNLPLLESAVVEANLVDHTLQTPFFVEFSFEDICFTRQTREPRTDMTIMVMIGGQPIIGGRAIAALFTRITDLRHQAGIMESLSKMELMMRLEPNFPSKVLGAFNYYPN
ncbi:hypothetical protein NHQ30_004900 [Ciborinia camelliae]|nr:hypothetical protein NHQ30_004900 [Ciborinia camelliae]